MIRRYQTVRSSKAALKASLSALALAMGVAACGPPAPPVNHIVTAVPVVPNGFTYVDHTEGVTLYRPTNPSTDSWRTDDLVRDPAAITGIYELAEYTFPAVPGVCAGAQLKSVRFEVAVDFEGAITSFTLPSGQLVYDGIHFSPQFPNALVAAPPVQSITGGINFYANQAYTGAFNGSQSIAASDTTIDVTYDATGLTGANLSDFYLSFNHSVLNLPTFEFGGSAVTTTPPKMTVTYDNTACV